MQYRENAQQQHTAASITVCHTPPGPIFDARYLHSLNSVDSVGAKWSALKTSRRELSQDVSFRGGTLLVVAQLTLENSPRGVQWCNGAMCNMGTSHMSSCCGRRICTSQIFSFMLNFELWTHLAPLPSGQGCFVSPILL